MNNEIKRKITSLTLMTIMLAGGMIAAAPSMVPAAHAANANLFVSAENSQFENYMSGPQVIEVVVIDSDINDTDQAKGEPDVTVNGKILRMVQAVDGNWYGYFADRNMALIADSTSSVATEGLDFGEFCSAASGVAAIGLSVTDTSGIAVPSNAGDNGQAGGALTSGITTVCAGAGAVSANNVVREAKAPNTTVANPPGLTTANWPFIQLYTLNPTGNVVVQYNKGGGVQTTTLTFDTVDQFAKASLDKAVYTQNSQVHATITDLWLNIDPTDEDSWTFGTVGTISTNYQVFNENGIAVGDTATNTGVGTTSLTANLGNLMCEDNCVLKFNPDVQSKGNVATLQDNDDSAIVATAGGANPQNPVDWQTAGLNLVGFVPITVTEQGPNSGIFGSYDESDTSNIVITSNAKRGTSASVDYNDTPVTILVGFDFAKVDIKPIDDEWTSGEEIPVEVTDADANKNSRADEDLDLNNPAVAIIPALKTGTPVTLNNGITVATIDGIGLTSTVDKFSERAMLTTSAAVPAIVDDDDLVLTFGTMNDIFKSTPINKANFHGYALLNYDVRALKNAGNLEGITSVDITVAGTTFTTQPLQGLILLPATTFSSTGSPLTGPGSIAPGTALTVNFNMNLPAGDAIASGTTLPVVADIFGFGFTNDGFEDNERIANQIIRLELEETGDNTGIFAGTLEYTMINQLNILDSSIYTGLTTIADEATFIVIEDLDDEESPRVTYNDLGTDGTVVQVSDQQAAPAHSGIVSFSAESYKIGDTVDVTLEDLDLNVDTDLIDIFTTVIDSNSVLADVVGDDTNSILLKNGDQLGRLLDVTFDDQLWTTPDTGACLTSLGDAGVTDTGLGATGFTLIETSKASGIFKGNFAIPSVWCRAGADAAESVTGLDIEVNYVDFRDAAGETTEVGDSAGIRANTGSVSLDRTVYPVPFGVPQNFGNPKGISPDNRSIFGVHPTGVTNISTAGSFLPDGDLTVHIRVNDPDFDVSASGEDKISQNTVGLPVGPVKISVLRGSETVILGFAGGPTTKVGTINVGNNLVGDGQIEAIELAIPANDGFTPGETINVKQSGVTLANQAAATFTNTGVGLVQVNELDILTSVNGQASPLSVTVDDGGVFGGADNFSAIFTDKNGDTNIDDGELTFSSNSVVFANGPVTIFDSLGASIATATFTDVLDSIDSSGELVFAPSPQGSGYESGTVTLVGATSGAEIDAIFTDIPTVTQFGPMTEIAPDAGIFELDLNVQYTDGPSDSICPETKDFNSSTTAVDNELSRFSAAAPSNENYCIIQGDILQVEYTDPVDASGDENTVTDSATFDLRNGVLQSDKSVFIIGSDMILTLIEPDLDLNNDQAETYSLDLVEWDSDAATLTMGKNGGTASNNGAAFDPEPLNFRETGDSTGIYQAVIEIPAELDNDRLERGEEIVLEYKDYGPSGSDFVGDEDEDVNLTIFTSNFGATVELDQKVYTWTDKVYITIVAPDHNFDSKLVDEIGNTDLDPIKVSTRGDSLDHYKLVETGTDTGIFTGEVILTGFTFDADGKTTTGDNSGNDVVSRSSTGNGPTDGLLSSDDDDGITVAFEFSEDETIVGSALIRWNIGETQWLEASYPASGTGVVRIIDPDMNFDPEAVDNFNVDVWSDSDSGGIDLTVTETNEATGIFEGTVFFTTTDESSGHRLRVAEGDTVTAEYEDNTLPSPYTTADELDIAATSLIGTIVPPLERAPIANCRVVDAFTNTLSSVSVDQQAQITCDISNGQDREQAFAYLVQIQDGNGVTVSLAWITGSLSAGQSFSPALSWIPTDAGSYTATAFVWESVDNPTALSAPVATTVIVK